MESETIAHGGVLVAIHHSVPARHISLRSRLQAVAVRVHLNQEVTVCSVYLPPGESLPTSELRRLMQELPSAVLIVGDFNAHNTAWGCTSSCTRGRLLESLLLDETLCVLNEGTRTHFTLPSGQTSALDLSLTSPELVPHFTWSVNDEPLGSDHFPIWLQIQNDPVLGIRPPRWNLRKADWSVFRDLVENSSLCSEEASISAETLTHIILTSAEKKHS